MNFSLRSLGLALLLLLLFLGSTLTLQWWLTRETRQLRTLAVEEQRARFIRTATVMGITPENWPESLQHELGAILGGTVELFKPDSGPVKPPRNFTGLWFDEGLPDAPDWKVRVQFATPALMRVQVMHQRTLAAIVVLSLLVATVPLLLVLIGSRRSVLADGASRTPWANTRAQAVGFEHFARISHERTAALAVEHDARLRLEEDLHVNRTLLDQSLAERIQLGRELHDNICQTLYAVCLTLESVQNKNSLVPELSQRVDRSIAELRRLNQEVRAYLQGLEPASLNGKSFSGAVSIMLAAFHAEEGVQIEQRIDEESAALLAPQQTAEIVNILREAVSNSVRHGRARNITLLAARNEQEVALAVQDDGTGFVVTQRSSGHGLGNMQARAAALGGTLRVESTPGKGTRVLLTIPVASPA